MKKIFAKKIVLSVIIMSMFFPTSDSFANTYRAKVVDYTIRYGENAKDYDDTSSKLNINGTTYLSLRSLASMLDLDIVWDNKEKTISILSDSENPSPYSYNSNNANYVYAKEVNFPIYIDGERKYPNKMEVVVNGTTYLSLRDLANMLNVPINWDSNTRSVTVGEKPLKNKDIAEKMLKLVNDFRAENGVAPLELMPEDTAREYSDLRSREIKEKFSHERPNGENVGDYEPLKNIYAIGENIHAGTRTVNTAFSNWKNSPGHRANMLNTKYTHMYSSQYGKSFVQLFGIRKQNNYNLYQNLQTQIIESQRQQEELQKQQAEKKAEEENLRKIEEQKKIEQEKQRQLEEKKRLEEENKKLIGNEDISREMLELVNEFRAENGLHPLKLVEDKKIIDYANLRAKEISKLFSQTRPNGKSSLYDLKSKSNYILDCAENISYRYDNTQDSINAWKASPAHRANMLGQWTHLAAGKYYDGTDNYYVQIFITNVKEYNDKNTIKNNATTVENNNTETNNNLNNNENAKNISKIIAEKKSQGYMVKKGTIIVENGKTALYLNDLLHLQATNDNGENFNVSVQKIILNGIDVSDYNSKSVTIAIGSHVEVTDKELISYDYEILE